MRYTFLLLISIPFWSFSQFAHEEDFLARTGREILENPEYEKRLAAADTFMSVLQGLVGTDKGFDYPFSKVSNMLRLTYEDEFRIFTWQMPDSNWNYIKFGLVASQTKKGIEVTELIDNSTSIMQPEFRQLKADEWYGAIYYQIVPVGKGKDLQFTLLGYIPGQKEHQKVIDVIEIDRRGRPRFGARIFHLDKLEDKTYRKPPFRLVLRYGAKYSASVRYIPEEEMIVMDHLSPPDAKLKGVYSTYGPDMSYDALIWKKDWWYLEEQVKFNSKQRVPIIPPNKPTDLPPGR